MDEVDDIMARIDGEEQSRFEKEIANALDDQKKDDDQEKKDDQDEEDEVE